MERSNVSAAEAWEREYNLLVACFSGQLHCIHRSTSITSHYIALHSISAAESFYLEFCINLIEGQDFFKF